MNRIPENRQAELNAAVRKLRRKRSLTVVLSALTVILFTIIASPVAIHIPGLVDYEHEGMSGVLIAVISLLILFVALIAYGYTILPIDRAMNEECDPEKYLALYTALGSKQVNDPNRQAALFTALFYMGRYAEALPHAGQLTAQKKPLYRVSGHFFIGLCGYFTNDVPLLREAALRFRAELATVEKMNDKSRALFDSRAAILAVMVGLCDGDYEAVAEAIPHMQPRSPAPPVTPADAIVIDTLKGIAALPCGDRDEAVHRFMTVREKGGRTCFVAMAEWYLEQLKPAPAKSTPINLTPKETNE